MLNNKYTITITTPLVRPGIVITTECSEKYVTTVVKTLKDIVRQINSSTDEIPSNDKNSV
jgi:hypothetical protein